MEPQPCLRLEYSISRMPFPLYIAQSGCKPKTISPDMTEKYAQRASCTAPELLLKLVLTGTQSHYENRGIIDDKRLEHLLHAGKQILFKSHQESDVRYVLSSFGVTSGYVRISYIHTAYTFPLHFEGVTISNY